VGDQRRGSRHAVVRTSLLGPAVLALVALSAGPALAELPGTPVRGTWGTNGTVYAITRIGDVAFLGGSFSAVLDPEGGSLPRANFAAIDLSTGRPTEWAPQVSGAVHALATDGRTIFVGGTFTKVNGQPRGRFAAIGPNGNLRSWTADASSSIDALTVLGSTIFMGGDFWQMKGELRSRLAAVTTAGELLDWNPSANARVRSLAVDRRSVLVAGDFTSVNGDGSRRHVARVDRLTGELRGFAQPPGYRAFDVTVVDRTVYAAIGGPGGRVMSWDIHGNTRWTVYADGDAQAIGFADGDVIAGGHWDYISKTLVPKLAALDPATGALDTGWVPRPSGGGIWAIRAYSDELLVGGNDFNYVGGVWASRFARFEL